MKNSWKIYMLTLITFLVGTAQFVIVGILDKVAASMGVSMATAGQLMTAFALGSAIGTPIVMVATAKMDQRKRLLLALSIVLLGIVLFALPGFGFLMVSRVVLGVGSGVFVANAYALAPKLAFAGREVRAMSNVALGFSAALVFGIPIGRIVAASFDWKVIFWVIGIFVLFGLFGIARTIPAMKGEVPIPLNKQLSLLKNPRLTISFVVTLLMFVGYAVINTYITLLLTSGMGISEGNVSGMLFAFGVMSMIGSKVGGFLSDRLGTNRTIFGGMVIQVVALVLLSGVVKTTFFSIPLLMLWGIAVWTFMPPQNFHLISIAPEASGIILSLNNSFAQMGFAVGAVIGGIVVGGSSILMNCWIAAVALVVAVILFGASVQNQKKHRESRADRVQQECI